jgi:signal transduction histidine kinase
MRGQGSLSVEVTADVIHELASLLERSEALTKELQDLNRTKSEIIQLLSHELFTPITTIQGFALTVAEHGQQLSSDEVRELATGVSRASERIRRLVGNLSAVARLDREGVEVSTRPVSAKEVIERAVSEFPHLGSRIQTARGGADGSRMWADQELAVRALVVLLENALQLTPDGQSVVIGVRGRGAQLEIEVSDRGPGIPPEKRDLVFEAFTQTDSSTTRTHEGLGIGLYLTRRIMAAHGGSVRVLDREGGGSTFVLSFPFFDEAEATA